MEHAIEESGLVSNVRIRLYNLPESQDLKVRNIRSKHLNEMIVIEGIIRQASDVRPQVVNAKFECPSCGTVISVLQMEKKFHEPSRCSCGRKGGFRLMGKQMVDTQRLIIEESPESLSGGEQPKRINIFVKEDLVEPKMEEKTTPGSKIKSDCLISSGLSVMTLGKPSLSSAFFTEATLPMPYLMMEIIILPDRKIPD